MATPRDTFISGIDEIVEQIVSKLDMSEQFGAPGANGELTPFLLIGTNDSGVIAHSGVIRVFKSPLHGRLISLKLFAEESSWSVQMACFLTDWDSIIPHFYVDCVYTNPSVGRGDPTSDDSESSYFQLTVDYLPKLDLIANPDYTNYVYHPLCNIVRKIYQKEECQEHTLAPKQTACMSPWFAAVHLPGKSHGIDTGNRILSMYFVDWIAYYSEASESTTAKVIPGTSASFERIKMIDRDRRHRAAFFNSDTHPVWFRIESMLGRESFSQFSQLFKPVEI